MELAEGAREGRLAALVGPGDDEDALGSVEAQVVADDRLPFAEQLVGEGEVEGPRRAESPSTPRRHRGKQNGRPASAKRADVVELGEVELDLAIEGEDRRVREPRLALAEAS